MKKGLLAAALAVMLTLTACGGAESDSSAEDLPRLVIASDNYKPYSYVGPNGNLIGVDVDLAAEACRRLGYAPEFCQIVWENKDAYLSSGQVDCLWGSFTMTGREDLYQWAGPYLYSRQMVAVRANSDIHTLADLAGRRVAVQATGKPEALFLTSSAPGVSQVEAVYAFSTMDEVYACLRKGYADAIAGHENALQLFLDSSPRLLPDAGRNPGRISAGGGLSKGHPPGAGPGPHPDPGGDGVRRDHPDHFNAIWPGR